MNESLQIPFCYGMLFFFLFSLPLHSLLFHRFFYCFSMLIKGDFEKKQRENEFENKSKNASHKGFI